MIVRKLMGNMTKDEREKEGIGALWDAIDVVLDCKDVKLPDWVKEELEHAQTKATIAFPHLRGAYAEKKREGL